MRRGSGIAMSCGVGHRHRSDPSLLWLWCRPAAAATIWTLSLGTSICCRCGTLKKKKRQKKKLVGYDCQQMPGVLHGWLCCLCSWALVPDVHVESSLFADTESECIAEMTAGHAPNALHYGHWLKNNPWRQGAHYIPLSSSPSCLEDISVCR